MLIYFMIGLATRFMQNEKPARVIAFLFFLLTFAFLVNNSNSFGGSLITALIHAVLVYLWCVMLIHADGTIFTWIILLVSGVFFFTWI